MSCSLNLREIGYERQNRTLFAKVNLNVGHEEKVAIIGANGCGKSTLLRIAAGIEKPTHGHVEIFHNKISHLKAFKPYRSEMGYLPQDVSNHFLCPTVIEDVMFSLRAKGQSIKEAKNEALEVLRHLGIEHLENRVIFELSGGEQKIVALAGLLVLQPKILLLDEPTNALDEASQGRILDILNGLNKSMIIVSHHKEFIEKLTPTIYKLENNHLEKL